MADHWIFMPAVAQVLLALVTFILLAVVKARARNLQEVDAQQAALHHEAWPDYVLKVSNNIRNQFETPILFYVLVLIFYSLEAVTLPALLLAWGYVISRILHSYVHMTSNYVPLRRRLFTGGCLILIAMTGLVFWQLVSL